MGLTPPSSDTVTTADRLVVGLRPDEMGDFTTEGCCLLLALRLDEHAHEGLRPGRTDEDPAAPSHGSLPAEGSRINRHSRRMQTT